LRASRTLEDLQMKALLVSLSAASLVLAGCTTVEVVSKYGGEGLPRPNRVIVYDLAVTPEEVRLDTGLSALAVEAMKGSSRTEQEIQAGHETAAALSKELVKKIQEMGLNAERGVRSMVLEPNDVVIEGQLLSVDEGNRTERVVIGLGAGRTDVRADIQMRQNNQVLEEFDSNAASARSPGMAETMGVGALAGHLLMSTVVSAVVQTGSETLGSTVEADASRTAKAIAKDLKPFFLAQDWIPAD
jgi:hypothetical protein